MKIPLTAGILSILKITDDEGDDIAEFTYDPFGVILDETGATSNQSLGFTGEFQDQETGFIYLRFRLYDPYTGSFITQDEYKGDPTDPRSLNRYVYAYNNPINLIDPSGYSQYIKFCLHFIKI